MIALIEDYDRAEDCPWHVAGASRTPTVGARSALAAKRSRSGRQRLANQARYSRKTSGSFQQSARQRPRKVEDCMLR